ncbi:bifunctional DNA primase/polymerase [Actinoplanes philippinensis]|uniref:bifunctional DNA primase/polymerase n=1 Tax=Actinoplanes philippinensis TaxID=35752 RepID=UPI0033FAAEB4
MSDLLTVALGHAERGRHVFPLVPDTKRPALDQWEQRATTDPARIERIWSKAPFGIGIACGPSGLLVIDLDMPKTQLLPSGFGRNGADVLAELCREHGQVSPYDTHTVTTASGGTHLYFIHPDGTPLRNTAGRLGRLIDTRAHGGYVVAAGSAVAGRRYTILRSRPPADLPGWLTRLLRPAPLPTGPIQPIALPAGRRGAYLRAAVDRTLSRLAGAPEGTRNAALFMAAQTLGQLVAGGELTDETVTTALTDAAERIGLHEREISATIRSGLRAGARRPRTVQVAA